MIKDDEILKIMGENIRRIRKAKGLTQIDIEVATGISGPNLSIIENGKTDIQVTKLVKLAIALGVEINSLYPISQSQK
ncbi:helix-turn-helix transcriptional regulator [Chitinophaga oryzae]|uniref:Helix-turn-helix transcriptional regulator n=1 Tax=Chitinophaga oryzae TaxID=2725414 RepID=A0AAE6ZLQ2_9BACT|nr:helix-turn-helix transcriptional regulator [Chitinophaga oryzae]QJB34902.1 helix-turn-helix transcriptional regulator [Chitinophaga oryzae]QJB41413.1 helix-turn-helix transcriptional regulator [Chitinophaga oryzae]